MSKLYDNYLFLKTNENNSDNTLYLFKSGIFFIFLDNDAKIASKLLNLKITYLTQSVVKCGFPLNSLEKYSNLLKQSSYEFKIVDTVKSTAYTINNYTINEKVKNLLSEISIIDSNTLSIKEAYNFIDTIQVSAKSIIEGDNNNAK
jgi:DNA mismatch repair ATPase MutS